MGIYSFCPPSTHGHQPKALKIFVLGCRVLEKDQREDLIRLGLWYKQKQLFLTGMKFVHLNLWSRYCYSSGDVCNQVEQVYTYIHEGIDQ